MLDPLWILIGSNQWRGVMSNECEEPKGKIDAEEFGDINWGEIK